MAASNAALSSGAGKDEAELRRRNVQSYQKANGGSVYKLEAEDTKKTQHKVRLQVLREKQHGMAVLIFTP